MLRVRLKADGRIVEILPDGSEQPMPQSSVVPQRGQADTAINARRIRTATRLSQTAFASRLGVPVETVRNWEQGKRAPRGPARALLKIIDQAPDTAFLLLETGAA
jgi:putative transcriptional regulator